MRGKRRRETEEKEPVTPQLAAPLRSVAAGKLHIIVMTSAKDIVLTESEGKDTLLMLVMSNQAVRC